MMYAVLYGPFPCPKNQTNLEFEKTQAVRSEKVVASESGCVLYQLVRNDDEYYYFELYTDASALDNHFKIASGGKRGFKPSDKINYIKSPLKILPVVGGFTHLGSNATIANIISLPMKDGVAFEAAVLPAMSAYDDSEPSTLAYLLCKHQDGSNYHFLELFADQAAVDVHSKSQTFKIMSNRIKAAKANDPSRKARWTTNMTVCTNTTRKRTSAKDTPLSKL
eukprot:m.266864 g.266864  ORF g.266864 m.266864 type:complete len:222 (+) comp69742_c0_seq1:326-991(+)